MQKSQKSGSILLWSICISFVLVFLFASFSARLSEKTSSEKSLSSMVENTFLQDGLVTGTGTVPTSHFEKVVQEVYSMQQNENQEYRYTGTTPFSITITLQKGGPLAFKFASFSGQTLFGGITASGYTDSSVVFTGSLSPRFDNGILYIKNLGGYASYNLDSSLPYTKASDVYKSIKTIGGEDEVEKLVPYKQFTPGVWGNLNYKKLDMTF